MCYAEQLAEILADMLHDVTPEERARALAKILVQHVDVLELPEADDGRSIGISYRDGRREIILEITEG